MNPDWVSHYTKHFGQLQLVRNDQEMVLAVRESQIYVLSL